MRAEHASRAAGARPEAVPDFYDSLREEMQLAVAAETGWTPRVRAMLDQGMSVETTYLGRTPLHAAIAGVTHWGHGGHPDVVELLLARGADPNRPFPPGDSLSGLSPLYMALREYSFIPLRAEREVERRRRVVEILLDFGARLERSWVATSHPNPVEHAADKCDARLLERLLEAGFALSVIDGSGPPIEVPCYNREIVRLLLDHGARPTPKFIRSVLGDHRAAWKAEIAHWLLDEGVDPSRYPFVRYAMPWNDHELLRRALEGGADPDEFVGRRVNFPLGYAAASGDLKAAEILLDHGADATKTWHDKTAEALARERGHTAVAERLRAHAQVQQ